jgi:hypothetical protein
MRIHSPNLQIMSLKSRVTHQKETETADTAPDVRDTKSLATGKAPEQGYTDEQFYGDLKKAGRKFDLIAQRALEEHAQGKTRKLP